MLQKETLLDVVRTSRCRYRVLQSFSVERIKQGNECSKWKAAIKEEMDSLRNNKTWELVDHPASHGDMNKVTRSYALGEYIYLFLYVDDMLIACKSKAEIGSTKDLLKKEFDMKELREAKKILGMEISKQWKSVKIPLDGHFKLSLKDCPVRDCEVERMSKVSYTNAVGSLMYLMVCTRPVIAYAVSIVSRYLANSGRGNHVDKATLQHVVALSTIEAEYMALTEAVKETIWLRGLLEELGVELNTMAVNCDNQGAIHLSRNHVFHERTKHINVRYHFIRDALEAKTVEVLKVGTEHNVADALTKVNPKASLLPTNQDRSKLLPLNSCRRREYGFSGEAWLLYSRMSLLQFDSSEDYKQLEFTIHGVMKWVSDDEPEVALKSPGQAPPSPDYVPGPEHPPSLDYVPGPEELEQASISPDYVHKPQYPEYLAPSDAEAPFEDQSLPDDASPTALSPGYVADSDPEEDPEEDPKEDPADRGDDADDESSNDDDDDDNDDEEQEASEDDDDEEEEEHPALADSSVVPVDVPVPSTEDTKAFEIDESAPTPVPSPRRRMARISVRPQTPMSAATKALIVAVAAAQPSSPPPSPLSPPGMKRISKKRTKNEAKNDKTEHGMEEREKTKSKSKAKTKKTKSKSTPTKSTVKVKAEIKEMLNGPTRTHLMGRIPSPPLPLPSPPTHTSPTYDEAPLGYRAAEIWLRAASPSTHNPSVIPSPPLLLPSTSHIDDLPEAEMPLWKRDRFTAPTGRFEVGESSAAAAARQPGLDVATMDVTPGRPMSREVGYGIKDVWDDMVWDKEERAPTMEALSQRDDKTLQRGRVNTLFKDRRYHLRTAVLVESKARCARKACGQAIDYNRAVHAELQAYRAQKMPLKRTAKTTTPRTDAQVKALISQGVVGALAEHEVNRSRNSDDSNDSGTGVLKELLVLLSGLKRWNLIVGHDVAYAMTWKTLKKMMTDKYCLRGEIKKLEIELWNLKVKGTDVESYNQRFQELALMCRRMFPKELDEVEKYIDGLPDMMKGSVMVSKLKKIQDAIEFATELMDQKIRTLAKRQAENKRKFEDTSRNNQN
ncbi:retrovirus-related pol polyprotein from transposon TNT 1-94 [Tanacetum coccineum]